MPGVHLSREDQWAPIDGEQYQERSGKKVRFCVGVAGRPWGKNSVRRVKTGALTSLGDWVQN